MTDDQWEILTKTVRGENTGALPIGFIIDSPWLPNWYGAEIMDYFSSDEVWLKANLKAIEEFPEVLFLPGFWSEFGMCSEPSAFGARCTFPPDEFPFAHKSVRSAEDIDSLPSPDPKTDGFAPFILRRLKHAQPRIEAAGHKIRFAVARGPLNVAGYLMGTTEFLTTMMVQPEEAEALVKKITSYLRDWLRLQMESFPSIDGVFVLDDIVGLIGEKEFRTFGLPYLKELFDVPVSVKFFHNDAPCKVSAPFLSQVGVNLFNMGIDVPLNEVRELVGDGVALIGNIPPRDVLANGTPEEVAKRTRELVGSLEDRSRVIISCAGGMPPGVKSENINALIEAVGNP